MDDSTRAAPAGCPHPGVEAQGLAGRDGRDQDGQTGLSPARAPTRVNRFQSAKMPSPATQNPRFCSTRSA